MAINSCQCQPMHPSLICEDQSCVFGSLNFIEYSLTSFYVVVVLDSEASMQKREMSNSDLFFVDDDERDQRLIQQRIVLLLVSVSPHSVNLVSVSSVSLVYVLVSILPLSCLFN